MSSSSACLSVFAASSTSSSSNNTSSSGSSVSKDKLLETAEKTLKLVQSLIKDGKLEEAQKLCYLHGKMSKSLASHIPRDHYTYIK